MSMLDEALGYSDLGLWLVPMAPDGRGPLLPRDLDEGGQPIPNTGGVKKASRDHEVIRGWFVQWPHANIACATGPLSGVFVLDLDTKGGKNGIVTLAALELRHGELPVTWTARTPSGGMHYYFRQPHRALRNKVNFRDGLDIRTTGGMATLPPSVRASGGVYAWVVEPSDRPLAAAPDWLLEMIDPPEPPRKPTEPVKISATDKAAHYVAAAVKSECEEMARAKQPGRNLKLFQAAANLGEFVGAGLLPRDTAADLLERAAEDCGLVREDGAHSVRATIQSGLIKGMANPREVIS